MAALFVSVAAFSEVKTPSAAPATLLSVEALLKRAAVSVKEKTYKGRFTYEFGSVLETLELVHSAKGGLERERILHLSGQKREFLMAGQKSDCLSVGALLLRGASFSSNGELHKLDQNYHFYIGADKRVAGRDAAIIKVVPKDIYRYGMTMGFDKASGLPLLSLIGNKNNTIERFQFVTLTEGDVVTDEDLEPTSGPYATLNSNSVACAEANSSSGVRGASWGAGWVPPGFVLSQAGKEQGYDEVLTYSDGLTSFSLFVVGLEGDALANFEGGVARRGATLVLMNKVKVGVRAYGVMLVGEVPIATAKKVFSSIKPT